MRKHLKMEEYTRTDILKHVIVTEMPRDYSYHCFTNYVIWRLAGRVTEGAF